MTTPAKLSIVPLAFTQFNPSVLEGKWDDKLPDQLSRKPISDADELHEFAGRLCYMSFDRPNPATATNQTYLKKSIIDNHHESVLEHSSFTFYVAGVSRSLLLELERHRHLSFSVVSQRYVGPRKDGLSYVEPPATRGSRSQAGIFEQSLQAYDEVFKSLREAGKPLKQAREAARAVLPSCAETRFVVSGNVRAWRHVIGMRTAPGADQEIQAFAVEIERLITRFAPNSMQTAD